MSHEAAGGGAWDSVAEGPVIQGRLNCSFLSRLF